MKRIINVEDAETHSDENGEYFAYSMTELAHALGARALGANLTRVPPGKAAFPFHHHYANEEHFFVLSGKGRLRDGSGLHEIRANDYIVHLPGGSENAHQLINTGTEDLVYLAMSTQSLPEVVGFPDSGKTGVRPAGYVGEKSRFMVAEKNKSYSGAYDDEDGAPVAAVLKRGEC